MNIPPLADSFSQATHFLDDELVHILTDELHDLSINMVDTAPLAPSTVDAVEGWTLDRSNTYPFHFPVFLVTLHMFILLCIILVFPNNWVYESIVPLMSCLELSLSHYSHGPTKNLSYVDMTKSLIKFFEGRMEEPHIGRMTKIDLKTNTNYFRSDARWFLSSLVMKHCQKWLSRVFH